MHLGKDVRVSKLRWSLQPVLAYRYDVAVRSAGTTSTTKIYMDGRRSKAAAVDAALSLHPAGAVCVSVTVAPTQ